MKIGNIMTEPPLDPPDDHQPRWWCCKEYRWRDHDEVEDGRCLFCGGAAVLETDLDLGEGPW